MVNGQADVVGAGIGGLAAAIALSLRGWQVRVHEKAAELRELGVGIGIWLNGQSVLEVLGTDAYVQGARRMTVYRLVDEHQTVLRRQEFDANNGPLLMLRQELHGALARRAGECGVEIRTNENVRAVSDDGWLEIDDGSRFRADLIVGADGYHSAVREELGLKVKGGHLSDASVGRVVVPLQPDDSIDEIAEHWSGPRRVGIAPTENLLYMFLSTPEDLEERESNSFSKERWTEAFPHLEAHFSRISGEVRWDRYSYIKCSSWSKGRVALIGDAAHAMPSTLAQGAGTALMDAQSLALEVTRADDVRTGLEQWERKHRAVIEMTQDVAIAYLVVSLNWPLELLHLRSDLIKKAMETEAFNSAMTAAARHIIE